MGDDQYPPRFAVCKRNKLGFQRDNIPLAESRDSVSGGEWGKAPHKAFNCF